MTNLEHLLENGLRLMKKVSYEEWLAEMDTDPNWKGNENIALSDLWAICQYVVYVWDKGIQGSQEG